MYESNGSRPLSSPGRQHYYMTGLAGVQMDHRLAALVARAREAARRRSFFLAFSSSPVDFINAQVRFFAKVQLVLQIIHLLILELAPHLTTVI